MSLYSRIAHFETSFLWGLKHSNDCLSYTQKTDSGPRAGHTARPSAVAGWTEGNASFIVHNSFVAPSIAEESHSNATSLISRSTCAQCQADRVIAGLLLPVSSGGRRRVISRKSSDVSQALRRFLWDLAKARDSASCWEQAAVSTRGPLSPHLCHTGFAGTAPPKCLTKIHACATYTQSDSVTAPLEGGSRPHSHHLVR